MSLNLSWDRFEEPWYLWVRGHHDPAAFLELVRQEAGALLGFEEFVVPADVTPAYTYQRDVKLTDEETEYQHRSYEGDERDGFYEITFIRADALEEV